MSYLINHLPIIELIVTICGSGGKVDRFGEYLIFLRIFADNKPYF